MDKETPKQEAPKQDTPTPETPSNVKMNGRFDGVGHIPGGDYECLNIDGVYTVDGNIQANIIDINGVTTIKGSLTAGTATCKGVSTIKGDMQAENINVEGVINVHGSKVYSNEVICTGVITVDGVLSADRIVAEGFINAHEIVGDNLRIESQRNNFWHRLFSKVKFVVVGTDYSQVDLIEATTVHLCGVRAKEVNGHDIYIGKYCIIEKVDCTGTLEIHPTAEVAEHNSASQA